MIQLKYFPNHVFVGLALFMTIKGKQYEKTTILAALLMLNGFYKCG